jgi:hypothetical protein
MANTILNDKRAFNPNNILHNGGFDLWQRGTTQGGTYTTATTGAGSANVSALTNVVTNIRPSMTVTGTTVGSSKTVSSLTSNTAIVMNSGSGATLATATATVAFGVPTDTYMSDRWYVLTQTSGVACARDAGDQSEYSCKITQNAIGAPGNQRFGLAQIVENKDTVDMRGNYVYFQCRFQTSNLQPVYAAILEWTGTADSATSAFVNDWTKSSLTSGQFFSSTTTTVTAVSSATTPTAVNTWTDLTVGGQVSSSATNLMVFVWTKDTAATGFVMKVAQAGLFNSPNAVNWYPRPHLTESELCRRFFERFSASGASQVLGAGYANSTTSARVILPFSPKITAPTIAFQGLVADLTVGITASGSAVATAVSGTAASGSMGLVTVTVASGLTGGQGLHIQDSGNATQCGIEVSADL